MKFHYNRIWFIWEIRIWGEGLAALLWGCPPPPPVSMLEEALPVVM